MRYSSVENWSLDTYNLNTKRAIVQEKGFIDSDCDYIDAMLSNIALQAVENYSIFNKSRRVNLGHLINVLSYA